MYDLIQQKKELTRSLELLTSEVKNLVEYKKALMKQIATLNVMASQKARTIQTVTTQSNTVKDTIEKTQVEVERWKDEQYKTVGKELEDKRVKLDQKSDQLTTKEKDLASHASQNALERRRNQKTRNRLITKEQSILALKQSVGQAWKEVELKKREIKQTFEELSRLKDEAKKLRDTTKIDYTKLDDYRKKEEQKLMIKSADLEKSKKSLKATEAQLAIKSRQLKDHEETLRVNEIRFTEKEKTLQRTLNRLKRQGIEVVV